MAAGFNTKLKLLVWKYIRYRKYHWALTVVEFCLPILLVYIIATLTEQYEGHSITVEASKSAEFNANDLTMFLSNLSVIYFAPVNSDIYAHINKFQQLVAMNSKKEYISKLHYQTLEDEETLVKAILENPKMSIGIYYVTFDNTTFRYKLRQRYLWRTYELYDEDELTRQKPMDEFDSVLNTDLKSNEPYFTECFGVVQYFLDRAYISNKLRYEPSLQSEAYPYDSIPEIIKALPYPDYTLRNTKNVPIPISFTIVAATLILLASLLYAIVNEKGNGTKVMMKIVGFGDGVVWFGWFISTLMMGAIVFFFISMVLVNDFRSPGHATLRVVDFTFLYFIIMYFFMAQIIFCYFFSSIFHNEYLALCSFSALSLMFAYLGIRVYAFHNVTLIRISCLFPAAAFIHMFGIIGYHEMLGVHVGWAELSHTGYISPSEVTLKFIFFALLFDMIFYTLLFVYIERINPGKFEYRRSLRSIFKSVKSEDVTDESDFIYDPIFKEKRKKSRADPTSVLNENENANVDTIVSIDNLKKKFDSMDALKGINLKLNKNEILALLGNAKSGKTTTIAILLGLTEPTGGSIKYRNTLDLLKNINEFRRELGFCPQENRLYPYFTVQQHLVFYGRLKGSSNKDAEHEARSYLEIMELAENADDLGAVISSEMKRKLSISIALMGNTEILILDEPTAGLDLASQNKIWALLTKLKKNRCVLVTTTTMKEASEVGDRIAVLNNGVVVCNGTRQFLEKAFAVGYEIKLKRSPPSPPDPDLKVKPPKDPIMPVLAQIRKGFPGTKIHQVSSELVFNVPSYQTNKFPALFKTLEARSDQMRVESIRVSVATLESVYMKIGGDSIYDFQGRPLHLSTIVEEAIETTASEHTKIKGGALYVEQFGALFKKKMIFTYRNWILFLYRVLFMTAMMVIAITGTSKLVRAEGPIVLNTKLYPSTTAIVMTTDMNQAHFTHYLLNYLKDQGVTMYMGPERGVEESAIAYGTVNVAQFRKHAVYGFDVQPGTALLPYPQHRIYYNKFARHGLPVALNTIHNALLHYFYAQNKNILIETINHPIENVNVTAERDKYNVLLSEHSPILLVWYLLLGFLTVDLMDFISGPTKAERIDGFKHIQFLSGVSPVVYWLNTLVFDFLLTSLIIIIRLIILKMFDEYNFLDTTIPGFFVCMLLIWIYILSGLHFEYLMSFVMNSRYGEYTFFLIIHLVGSGLAFAFFYAQTEIYRKEHDDNEEVVGPEKYFLRLVYYIMLLIAPINFSLAFFKYIKAWRVNSLAALAEIHPTEISQNFQEQEAEVVITTVDYLEFASKDNPDGILLELLFLIVDIFIYIFIIYLIEFNRIGRMFYEETERDQEDEDVDDDEPEEKPKEKVLPPTVVAEQERVKNAVLIADDPEAKTSVVFISEDLQKSYRSLLVRQQVVIDRASFVVNAGECFGILGPSESGKTTIFKMLAGEITPTSGEAWIMDTKLSVNRTEYFSKAGYCTQSDSFLKELTGKEILELVATLRGVPAAIRRETIENWALILGLDEVFSEQCHTYNEGNTRKLCAALALVGEPNVIFLDEPASGIDPISRRSLYTVLGRSKTLGQAILVSSKSMQECEALCDRFVILINGKMKFIGSPDDLKQQYAQAFTLIVILKNLGLKDTEESRIDDLLLLKFALQGKFGTESCVLISETWTTAHYEINYTMAWSEAFQTMEVIKKGLKFVQEYHLSEKSLEDVYRSFIDE